MVAISFQISVNRGMQPIKQEYVKGLQVANKLLLQMAGVPSAARA